MAQATLGGFGPTTLTPSWAASRAAGYDAAFVKPHRAAGAILPRDEDLHSTGFGLRLNYGKNVTGLMMVAVPLVNTGTFKDKHDPEYYIGLDYSF